MSNDVSCDSGERRGRAVCDTAASDVAPRDLESEVIAPARTIGLGANTTRATLWYSTLEETQQAGNPDFANQLHSTPAFQRGVSVTPCKHRRAFSS